MLVSSNGSALTPNNPSYICNHAAALLSLLRPREAMQDCERALAIDPNFVRAYQRWSKAQLMLGNIDEAKRLIEICIQKDPNNATFKEDVCIPLLFLRLAHADPSLHLLLLIYAIDVAQPGALRGEDAAADRRGDGPQGLLRRARSHHAHYRVRPPSLQVNRIASPYLLTLCSPVVRYSPFSVKLRLVRAEIQLFLKRYAEASSGAADILREDTGNAEAFYLRGRALYYQSKFDQVRTVLRSR